MNNKGFTLTELLVTIAVMAIIAGIAFPAISNLKGQNVDEKYKAYEQVMLNSAKIYYDSNKEDMEVGCYSLTKDYLVTNNIITNYNKSNSETLDGTIYIQNGLYGTVNYCVDIEVSKSNKIIYRKECKGMSGCEIIY